MVAKPVFSSVTPCPSPHPQQTEEGSDCEPLNQLRQVLACHNLFHFKVTAGACSYGLGQETHRGAGHRVEESQMHSFLRKTMTLKPSASLCFCVHSASLFIENGPQVNAIVSSPSEPLTAGGSGVASHRDPRGAGTHGKTHPLDRGPFPAS